MTANEPIKSHNFRAGGPTPQPRLSLAEQRLSRKRGTFSGIAFAGVTGGSHLNCPHSGDGSPRGGAMTERLPLPSRRSVRYATLQSSANSRRVSLETGQRVGEAGRLFTQLCQLALPRFSHRPRGGGWITPLVVPDRLPLPPCAKRTGPLLCLASCTLSANAATSRGPFLSYTGKNVEAQA